VKELYREKTSKNAEQNKKEILGATRALTGKQPLGDLRPLVFQLDVGSCPNGIKGNDEKIPDRGLGERGRCWHRARATAKAGRQN